MTPNVSRQAPDLLASTSKDWDLRNGATCKSNMADDGRKAVISSNCRM
ncbi:hypothetical protein ABID82_001669 [Methylobacterium sp. PvP062]|uniref:Uncharacterized protein n=2 Tax=Methylobacterium TaxID=407 RepID=A0A509ECP5_9HYPH|nr:hypothetical protein [Methylobacterium organophilum]MBN6818452.1 hypothetical protein [Methylobacterium organophilum]MBP2492873.1 hypothetical protein [Methylobacterium sp. PvP105]MBP2500755.1 hypothetical protein [Methylobacterium sp. PvP109]VUD70933.1 hypothetical protein MET9862_01507 [Methylobacterium symbioticum]